MINLSMHCEINEETIPEETAKRQKNPLKGGISNNEHIARGY